MRHPLPQLGGAEPEPEAQPKQSPRSWEDFPVVSGFGTKQYFTQVPRMPSSRHAGPSRRTSHNPYSADIADQQQQQQPFSQPQMQQPQRPVMPMPTGETGAGSGWDRFPMAG
jgi:hypothetical protein